MRTILAFGFAVMTVTPAFAGRALCDRIGNDCQTIFQSCLVDARSMGDNEGKNCRYQLAKSATTGMWHVKTKNVDCPCR